MKNLFKDIRTTFSAHNFLEWFFVIVVVLLLGTVVFNLCAMWAAEIVKYIYG